LNFFSALPLRSLRLGGELNASLKTAETQSTQRRRREFSEETENSDGTESF